VDAERERGARQAVAVHDHRQRRLRDLKPLRQFLLRALRALEVCIQGRELFFPAHDEKILLIVNHCQQKNITIRKPLRRGRLPQQAITVSDTIPAVALADELRRYLAELLSAKGLNQKDLAKSVGASQGYVSMILSGQRLGNEVAVLERLARAVDRPLSSVVAEAERRDLIRHGRTGQQDSHPQGVSDVPASDRLRDRISELEGQLDADRRQHERLVADLSSALGKLLRRLADDEGAPVASSQSKVRGARRRTG
jgi:transcriptional regulator with XRE-family HTH domain